jgi:hypothetical protein
MGDTDGGINVCVCLGLGCEVSFHTGATLAGARSLCHDPALHVHLFGIFLVSPSYLPRIPLPHVADAQLAIHGSPCLHERSDPRVPDHGCALVLRTGPQEFQDLQQSHAVPFPGASSAKCFIDSYQN